MTAKEVAELVFSGVKNREALRDSVYQNLVGTPSVALHKKVWRQLFEIIENKE